MPSRAKYLFILWCGDIDISVGGSKQHASDY